MNKTEKKALFLITILIDIIILILWSNFNKEFSSCDNFSVRKGFTSTVCTRNPPMTPIANLQSQYYLSYLSVATVP